MSASPEVFAATRQLYAMGYVLVPLAGKKPIKPDWRKRRFTLKEVEAELKRPEATGSGFPGGELNHGILAIDFDSPEGEAWWREECERAGLDPDNFPTVITPGKLSPDGSRTPGLHRYVHDHRGLLTNAEGKLRKLRINMRGRGQTVLPPSPHPDGGFYEWMSRHAFADFLDDGIPHCPDFVYEAVAERPHRANGGEVGATARPRSDQRAHKYCRAALDGERQKVGATGKGHRNQALNDAALALGGLFHHGAFTEAEARAALHGACIVNGLIADDGERSFAASFSSGWVKGVADPRDLPKDRRGPTPGAGNCADTGKVQFEDFVAYMPDHTYIFRPTRQPWPGASVNSRLPPVLVGKDEINASQWLDRNSPVEQMTWAPGESEVIHGRLINDSGWIERRGVSTYNLYRPPIIVSSQGDASPWLEHITVIYPDAAEHIISWLAHRVQRPAEKINHALVLGGEQGIGKDTILEPVKQAVGAWNFGDIGPRQALGRFNGYFKSTILRISEARDLGDFDRFALYDHLKAVIAAPPDTLRIDEKNIREYTVPNVVGVIITTNHKIGALYLPPDDRRHHVAWSALSREMFTPDYFMRLYRWYADGGTEIVADYLGTLDISKFNPKAPPPQTEAFWQMVNSNRAPETAELADRLEALGNPVVVTLDELRVGAREDFKAWLCDRKNSRAILHRLEDCGYEAVRNPDARDGLWRISDKRQAVYGKRDLTWQEKRKAAGGLR